MENVGDKMREVWEGEMDDEGGTWSGQRKRVLMHREHNFMALVAGRIRPEERVK